MDAIEESSIPKQEIDDSVELLRRDIDKELARIGSRNGMDSGIASFKPALNEASMIIEKYSTAESAQEAFDAMYNARFSLGYYLADLSE